jgi:predicted membrane GTPase involved in stress response
MTSDMTPLMQMILDKVPAPEVNIDGPLQLKSVLLIAIVMWELLE